MVAPDSVGNSASMRRLKVRCLCEGYTDREPVDLCMAPNLEAFSTVVGGLDDVTRAVIHGTVTLCTVTMRGRRAQVRFKRGPVFDDDDGGNGTDGRDGGMKGWTMRSALPTLSAGSPGSAVARSASVLKALAPAHGLTEISVQSGWLVAVTVGEM